MAELQKWESAGADVERLAVPGGWLYRVITQLDTEFPDSKLYVNLVFVPSTTVLTKLG